jgi:diguanylate cyclase (GGDEF)-like protein
LRANKHLLRSGSHIFKFLSSDHIEAQYHETIYTMMITDGLTGIHNKRIFLETLDRELVRSNRHCRPLALVMFDLDHFKSVNDTHGHLAGDAVLREVSARIRASVRKDEIFARYGGEEFAVLLPESNAEEARAFAERLRLLVAETAVSVNENDIPVTISVGVAHNEGMIEPSPEAMIALADQFLYEAKRSGRNCVKS